MSKKSKGDIFTPPHIVSIVLDYAGYTSSDSILEKHILENSCGDGRFLCEIVRRYIEAYRTIHIGTSGINHDLERYIHGIELDSGYCKECVNNLNAIVKEEGIEGKINWDVRCIDALFTDYIYKGALPDYIVGNPPYVRIHNMDDPDSLAEAFTWCSGMTDLYIAFWQKSLTNIKNGGVVCFITPSSWVTSVAGREMRSYLRRTGYLRGVIDFKDTQVFDNAQTYVMVTLCSASAPNWGVFKDDVNLGEPFFHYDEYDPDTKKIKDDTILKYSQAITQGTKDTYIDMCSPDDCAVLHEVRLPHRDWISVKNGFATLKDEVFINEDAPEEMSIRVVKATTKETDTERCVFPYTKAGPMGYVPISLDVMEDTYPEAYNYLLSHKQELLKRKYDGNWYTFGRSQGLSDLDKMKISINNTVKTKDDLHLNLLDKGVGVYGGLYIVTDNWYVCGGSEEAHEKVLRKVMDILSDDKFIRYVFSLKKYKSGGYCTFSSKDAEAYINWILDQECDIL